MVVKETATRPGSIFNRHGGSIFSRRQQQLKDFIDIANDKGYTFILYTRTNTHISSTLQKLADDGLIIIEKVIKFP